MKHFELSTLLKGMVAAAVFASAASLSITGAHAADAGEGKSGDTFKQLDANQDGAISKDEAAAMAGLSAVFDQSDTNRDGKLDKDEFGAATQAMGMGN